MISVPLVVLRGHQERARSSQRPPDHRRRRTGECTWITSISRSRTSRFKPADPCQALRPVEAVHRHPEVAELGNEGVLPRQQVGDVIGEPSLVSAPDRVHQELLGPATAETLDEQQDARPAAPLE